MALSKVLKPGPEYHLQRGNLLALKMLNKKDLYFKSELWAGWSPYVNRFTRADLHVSKTESNSFPRAVTLMHWT